MINIPLYNQGDVRWGSKRLGTTGLTMRNSGCYVVAITMVVNAYGYSVNPGQTCDALNNINGFDASGQVKWESVEALFPNAVFSTTMSGWTTNFDLANNISKIQQTEALRRCAKLISLGMPVVLCVDNQYNDRRPDHAIVLWQTGPRWMTNDPDGGIVVPLEPGFKYGPKETAIFGFRTLIGPATSFPEGTSNDTMTVSLAAWKAAMVAAGRSVNTYSREIFDALLS